MFLACFAVFGAIVYGLCDFLGVLAVGIVAFFTPTAGDKNSSDEDEYSHFKDKTKELCLAIFILSMINTGLWVLAWLRERTKARKADDDANDKKGGGCYTLIGLLTFLIEIVFVALSGWIVAHYHDGTGVHHAMSVAILILSVFFVAFKIFYLIGVVCTTLCVVKMASDMDP